MELIGVEICGYRRFADSTNVRLLEGLIALVGPNEAGKTSFLNALEELNEPQEIKNRDRTRRLDNPTQIKAIFELDSRDRDALSHIEGGAEITQYHLTKDQDGEFTVDLQPAPDHDHEPRNRLRETLSELRELPVVSNYGSRGQQNNRDSLIGDVIGALEREEDYLGESRISQIRKLASTFEELVENAEEEDHEYDIESVKAAETLLNEVADHEEECAPKMVKEELYYRRPEFLLFKDEDRDLRESYDLSSVVPNSPRALSNLAQLADLNLRELKRAAESEDIPYRKDLLEAANEELKEEFSQAWVREEVVPVLEVDGTVLHLLVRTPDEAKLSRIDERSDGLRWFVALLAFLSRKNVGREPILLVDEAESHLSYDAQANLIEVLETQKVAQKVIYTTHSAGCLPSDLGTGIRPVIPLGGERSDIRNGFWTEGPGFKPLMLAMGLSPLAFSVARNALIAEGPSETILLPTLIRQSIGSSGLEYQVAPGAASVGSNKLPELLSETGQAVIILDGDDAGEEMKNTLKEAGADPDRIKTYRDITDKSLVFEDLIDREAFAEAFNKELRTWQNPGDELTTDDLPEIGTVEAVNEWCEERSLDPVNKPTLCQRLAEMGSHGTHLVAADCDEVLQEIHQWAREHYVIPE